MSSSVCEYKSVSVVCAHYLFYDDTMHSAAQEMKVFANFSFLALAIVHFWLYWYAKQRVSFFIFLFFLRHNAWKFIPFRNHKSNRFLPLSTLLSFFFFWHKYNEAQKGQLFIYGWRLAEISQASSCDVLLCRCGLPLTHWIAFPSFLVQANTIRSFLLAWPKLTKSENLIKKNPENLFHTCNGA